MTNSTTNIAGAIKAGLIALASLTLLSTQGCGYPEISPRAYELSKTLYSTCSLKRESDLDKITELITQAQSMSELTDSEGEWLAGIVNQARSGDWQSASEEARAILDDQVGR